MRQTVLLVIVGVVLFVGTYLIVSGETPFKPGPLDLGHLEHPEEPAAEVEGVPIRPLRAEGDEALPGAAPTEPELAVVEEPIDDLEFGALGGEVTGSDGSVPPVLEIALSPRAGVPTRADGGVFEVRELPPGAYQLRLSAEGYVPRLLHDLKVTAGRKRLLDIELTPGIRPRGTVVDDVNQLPIRGAIVEFGGALRARTDAAGHFVAPYAADPEGIRDVILTHPDFDRTVYRGLGKKDVGDLTLAMSRGKAAISLSLVNASGAAWPPTGRLRLFHLGGDRRRTLKRELTIDPREVCQISGVHHGTYLLAVDFPTAPFPRRQTEVFVQRGLRTEASLTFERGVELRGQLIARAAVVASRKVELLDLDGHAVATGMSDRGGHFVLPGVLVGHYRIRVWMGLPAFNTGNVAIEDREVFEVTIDCDRQRLRWE